MGNSAGKGSRLPPSTLEQLIRDGKWDDARSCLSTPEGQSEVQGGLVSYQKGKKIITSAIFTAVFHRAPLDVIQAIKDMKPDELSETDLHCALASDRHRQPNSQGIERRNWHRSEHEAVIELLVEGCPPTAFLKTSPPSMTGVREYTPLGHALDNQDISPRITKCLCFKEPRAIETDCYFMDGPIRPLALAMHQTDKRDLILLGMTFYQEQNTSGGWERVAIPDVGIDQFDSALKKAVQAKEWDLVGKLLPDARVAGMSPEDVHPVEELLEAHQKKARAKAEKEARNRKNFGMAMYPVDVIMDLVSAVTPSRRGRGRRQQEPTRLA